MAAEFWTQLRFLLLYPVMTTFGLAWFVAFWLRWRRTRCPGDRWAALLGAALAGWAFAGILGLWLSKASGFGSLTSLLFAVGASVPAVILVAGVVYMFLRGWRSDKPG